MVILLSKDAGGDERDAGCDLGTNVAAMREDNRGDQVRAFFFYRAA